MLSILIPVYNFDVTRLVHDLHEEALNLSEKTEIVLIDDGSEERVKVKNRLLEKLPLVSYEESDNNLGRSGIRNYLARKAKYDYLLFLDNDQVLPSYMLSSSSETNFLKNYLEHLNALKILVGGRCYGGKPSEKAFILHWKVGKSREEISASVRTRKPHDSFLSCNFVVPKSLFKEIKFDESLTQYGHEDTLFGLELERREIEILHLENPVEHLGLEPAEVFLSKSEKAIENLVYLHRKTGFSKTKLIHLHRRIKVLGLGPLVGVILKIIRPLILRNLKSASPKLLFFDLFKLGVFIEKVNETE